MNGTMEQKSEYGVHTLVSAALIVVAAGFFGFAGYQAFSGGNPGMELIMGGVLSIVIALVVGVVADRTRSTN